MATPSPQIDLPPSIARIRFDSFSESKNISHESSGRGFEDRSKDNSAAVQTSLKTSAKSLSFVSPPPRFVKRTRFLDSGRSMDSPEFTTDSPLQPKNFADLLYEQDVVIRESTPPIKKAFATEEALLSKTTPAPRHMATEGKAIRPPTQYSFSKGASWGSNSVGRQVPLSPSFVPSSKSPKRPVASPGKYSPSRFAGGLTFDPQFFGLNLSVDDAMMGHRFTGLYRWQRVQNEKNKPGRRKGSVARVYMIPGKGEILINGKPYKEHVARESLAIVVTQPLELLNQRSAYNISINVNGGGLSGQAGAIRLGIARALNEVNSDFRHQLKDAGFLTRDAREVERKKYGQPGARKKFQFSKR